MRTAPPVAWHGLEPLGWRLVQALLAGMAAAAAAAWGAAHVQAPAAAQAAAALLGGVIALALAWRTLPAAPAFLGWDGARWRAGPDPARTDEVTVEVAADLGRWVLLRCRRTDGARRAVARARSVWLMLPVPAGADGPAMRAALYSSAFEQPLASAVAERHPD